MSTQIEPYLFFDGRCEEAISFYRSAIGAELQMLMHYKDCPEPMPPGRIPEGWEEKVMHASFKVGDSTLMASDGCGEDTGFEGFSLSLTMADEAQARRTFEALADGGEIRMPLSKTFWSPLFGMVADRFGIGWMITLPA